MGSAQGISLSQEGADIFTPNGEAPYAALARTTHLAIGAHQDDLEVMAFHGIVECLKQPDASFTGVICTDGRGSSRIGPYRDLTDDQMREVRREEQRKAATIGEYGLMLQLDHRSESLKRGERAALRNDLIEILHHCRPTTIYLHNPADKHLSHLAVLLACIEAIRQSGSAPSQVWGCEVWRDLDWLPDARKGLLEVEGFEPLALDLLRVFDSQVSGGKRYDLAILGRRRANATMLRPYSADGASQVTFAVDLTPLCQGEVAATANDLRAFAQTLVAELSQEMGAAWESVSAR